MPLLRLPTGAKQWLARLSLLALAAMFELASRRVAALRDELARWDDGRRVGLGVLPDGPSITLAARGGQIDYLGAGLREPEVSLLFKNLDSALLIFTGQLGAHHAAAENRVCIHGDNAKAMQVTRAMAIVQSYLMPRRQLRQTLKRLPPMSGGRRATKALLMAALPLAIARAARR
jgi:hypothetical protein